MTMFETVIASDFQSVMDNLEPITVTLNRNIPETVSVAAANRSEMSRSLIGYNSVELEDDDIGFTFAANQFVPTQNPADIRQGDLITDAAGAVYKVQRARLTVLQTVWSLACKRKTVNVG